eukprot:1149501-Pelagomonas_calceolata.AAC.4
MSSGKCKTRANACNVILPPVLAQRPAPICHTRYLHPTSCSTSSVHTVPGRVPASTCAMEARIFGWPMMNRKCA